MMEIIAAQTAENKKKLGIVQEIPQKQEEQILEPETAPIQMPVIELATFQDEQEEVVEEKQGSSGEEKGQKE